MQIGSHVSSTRTGTKYGQADHHFSRTLLAKSAFLTQFYQDIDISRCISFDEMADSAAFH
jgi:hypothetical protein